VAALGKANPGLTVTADPVEFRGYRYHTGLCFTVFATAGQAELGQGGRYLSGDGEPATGISLYPDTIVRVAPAPILRARVYLPSGTGPEVAAACRERNFATVAGLDAVDDPAAEAARLGCTHVYANGEIVTLIRGAQ
jgi:ATP phosphoribosyltransferase regulatory subunit